MSRHEQRIDPQKRPSHSMVRPFYADVCLESLAMGKTREETTGILAIGCKAATSAALTPGDVATMETLRIEVEIAREGGDAV